MKIDAIATIQRAILVIHHGDVKSVMPVIVGELYVFQKPPTQNNTKPEETQEQEPQQNYEIDQSESLSRSLFLKYTINKQINK